MTEAEILEALERGEWVFRNGTVESLGAWTDEDIDSFIYVVEHALEKYDNPGPRLAALKRERDRRLHEATEEAPNPVSAPPHYRAHPSGIECIQVTEHLSFLRGNAIKYLWRAGQKGNIIEDLEKARWYIEREIELERRKSDGA